MFIPSRIKHRAFLLVFSLATLSSNYSYSGEASKVNSSDQSVKDKGVKVASEVLIWSEDKSNRNNELAIENTNFTVFYPKCYSVIGEEGDEDLNPKTTPTVVIIRGKDCPEYDSRFSEGNFIGITHNYRIARTKSLDAYYSGDKILFKQKVKINEIDAVIHAGTVSYLLDGKYEPMLRWRLFMICNKKAYQITVQYPPGKPTQDRIKDENYAFPNDFKKIVSSFICK